MLINNKNLIKTIKRVDLTTEQETNLNEISNIKNDLNNIKNTELENLNTAINTLETLVGDKTGLPSGDANVIASINRIDEKTGSGSGLTDEQLNKLNSIDNKVDKVEGKTLTTNDYTNEEKQTVASLKATVGDTSSGLVKDVKDLKTNGVSQNNINTAVEKYLQDNPIQSGATTEQAAQIEANKNALGGLSFKKVDTKEEYDNLPESDIGNPNLVLIKSYEEPITKDSFSLTVGENGEYQFRVNGDIKFSFNAGSGGVIENVYGNILLDNNTVTIDEESSFSLNISLDKAPTNSQTVYISTSNELLTKSVSSLTFNSSNYSNTQSVAFTAIADDDVANNECQITFSSEGVPSIVCTVSITDNDTPTGEIAITGINIVEDNITLTQWEPMETDLTINYTPSNTTQTKYWMELSGGTNKVANFVSKRLYGRKPGTGTLTVTSSSDSSVKDTCNITVVENTKTKVYGEEMFDLSTVVTSLVGNVESAYFNLEKDLSSNKISLTFNKTDTFTKSGSTCCVALKIDNNTHFFKYGHLYKIEYDYDFNFEDASLMRTNGSQNTINVVMNVNAGTNTVGAYYINDGGNGNFTGKNVTGHVTFEGMCIPNYVGNQEYDAPVLLMIWTKFSRNDSVVPETFTYYISNISIKEFTLTE